MRWVRDVPVVVVVVVGLAFSAHVGCSSTVTGDGGGPPDFCAAAADALQRCSTVSSGCAGFNADCSKLTALLNPTLLEAAAKCMKTRGCEGGGPLSCLGSTLGETTSTPEQKTLATNYCASCSVVGGDACGAAFFASDGSASALGYVLLPFGNEAVNAVDTACTSSALGKTACQAKFSSCAQLELATALAKSISTGSATCLLSAIEAGVSGATGPSDGGGDAGDAGDGGGACTDLTNTGSFVTLERVVGPTPSGSGGTPTPGTYTLLSVRAYDGAASGTATFKRTIRLGASSVEGVTEYQDTGETERVSGIYIVSGKTISRSYSCPPPMYTDNVEFTSTATTLTLFFPREHIVYTYGRQ